MAADKKKTLVSENTFNRDTAIVTKRNELIAGHALMSINETRIFHAALAMIDSREHDVGVIRITQTQLAYALNTTVSNVGKMISPANQGPGILDELQQRYVKAPMIFDTRAISINGWRAVLSDGDVVKVAKKNNHEVTLKDKNNRTVYFKPDLGLVVFNNNVATPPELDSLVDAIGQEIDSKGRVINGDIDEDLNDRSKDKVLLYVDSLSIICGEALAKDRRSAQMKNISIFDMSVYLEEKGVIELEFGESFKPYVIGLKENFTKSYFKYLVNLTNQISTDLYEVLRQELPINAVKRGKLTHTFTISVEKLRERLGITEKYLRPADFKRAVLERSKEQINGRTDLEFDYEFPERRNSKKAKITKVSFTVKATKVEKAKIIQRDELLDELSQHFGERLAKTLIDKFGKMRCHRNVNLYYRAKLAVSIRNPVAWIREAIRFDYVRTKGVLSLKEYGNPIERQFVDEIVRLEWDDWEQDDQDDFIKFRLKAPYASIRFNEFLDEFKLHEKYANKRVAGVAAKNEIDARLSSDIYD